MYHPTMATPVETQLIESALARRAPLIATGHTTAYRILNGAADGTPGVVAERFGPALIVQFHEGRSTWPLARAAAVAEAIHARLGTTAVYLKHFPRDRAAATADNDTRHRDATPWIGEPLPPELTIDEHGLKFAIRPYDGFSVGLFLEHRDNRRLIRDQASGRRVLNLFAYTCGFSVTAAQGGANHVASVDLSKRYLEWGRQNFALNGLQSITGIGAASPESGVQPARPGEAPPSPGAAQTARFYASDTFDFYHRAERQGLTFDLVVLDPPTFSRTRRPARVFELDADLGRLLSGALGLLSPGGKLFFATNFRQLSLKRIEAQLHAAAESPVGPGPARRIHIEKRPTLPADFAGDADYAKSILVRVE